MSRITAIITAYRRPGNILPLIDALRSQSERAAAIWVWANEPNEKMKAVLAEAKLDRVVTSSDNARFHGRFALALLAPTEFVAILDDDSIPGEQWFANCLDTMQRTPGILGTAGVVLHEPGYAKRTMHGWQKPSDDTVEVDLVGQAWFLRTEWVKHLFCCPAVTGTNGEDIELAARAWRLARIRSYCPPHPANDTSRWGSIRGLELGIDEVAASLRVEHLAERKLIVEAEISTGWQPLFMRHVQASPPAIAGTTSRSDGEQRPTYVYSKVECGPRWSTTHSYRLNSDGQLALDGDGRLREPPCITLTLDGVGEGVCCLACLDAIESLGQGSCDTEAQYDRIELGPALEKVRDPLAFLRRARRLLKRGGELTASVANTRRESVIRSLIEGHWTGEGIGNGERGTEVALRAFSSPHAAHEGNHHAERDAYGGMARSLRFFTRREIEKLLYRAGFGSVEILPEGQNDERDGLEKQSFLMPFVNGLREGEAQEFSVERYGVTAAVESPRAYRLTSIVILTHNELACTHACLQSIRFVTDEPYELIIVDNGSTDGTVDYLRSCSDVKLIENPDNRGFPAAANQGIRASSGQQIVLLNNDVLVTTGWLDRLLQPLRNNKTMGLVGPLTNCASGYQEIAVPYTDLACLDGFAWEHAKTHAGRAQDVDRLIGFCLLIRREVIDQVGLLDERFGIGNFEDDDYCRRVRNAGWRLAVAQDAFIHHFGHRTFDGAGVDLNSLLVRNRKIYDDKWAEESPKSQVQSSTSPQTSLNSRPSSVILSLCMIVRNNARTIRAAIESAKPWFDEIIVVDTGSTDATPDICRELGAQVYHFPWPDSFSIARNESLKHARGQWIFWMDSDDVIDADNGRKLRALAYRQHEANVLGYVMQVHCPGNGPDGIHDVTVVDHLKLLRNRPDLRFEGRIHEQLLDAINRAGGNVVFTDIFVVHAGADHSPEGRKRKLRRDIKLLRLDRRERPNHTFVYFNLGMTYADAGKHSKAIKALCRSLELAQQHESHVRKVYALLVASHRELGEKEEARKACAEGLKLYPKDPELLFRNAMLAHEDGRLRAAELNYLAALRNDDALHFSSIDRGIVGFKARHNLAAVYSDMGALHKAEAEWRSITEEVPGYGDGWRGLAEILIGQSRLHDATELSKRMLDEQPRHRGVAAVILARVAEAAGQVPLAQQILETAVEEFPDETAPLDELCRVLFHNGALSQIEQALSELLRRQPNNASAQHNLATAFLRAGRFQEAADTFRMSLRNRPNSALTQLSLGYALSSANQRAAACAAFEQCVRLAPEPRVLAEAQRQLAALAA